MRKTYRLRTWRGWDRQIDTCARDFLAEFGVTPNVLLANEAMLRRMNVVADKAHVGNELGGSPEPASYVELKGFAGPDYELLFIEQSEVPENSFDLIHAFSEEDTEVVASL